MSTDGTLHVLGRLHGNDEELTGRAVVGENAVAPHDMDVSDDGRVIVPSMSRLSGWHQSRAS